MAIANKVDADTTEVVADRGKEELKRLGRDSEIADVMIDLELLDPEVRAAALQRVREELTELHERYEDPAEAALEPGVAGAR